jgi:type IV fimbrial biogenesis protein FimT
MAPWAKGFSLTELVVVIAIMAVLLSLGLPAFATYSRNIKLRAAADSFLAGMQLARGEAVRLNTAVELILTNAAPVIDDGSLADYPVLPEGAFDNLGVWAQTGKFAANFPASRASSAADPSYNWLVRTLPAAGGACGANPGLDPQDPAHQAKGCWFLSGKRGAEGSGSATDSGSPILIAGPATISFNSLGGASLAADFDISSPIGGACALDGGPIRCLRVHVELGGRAKLCDPAANAPGDTRGCA